VLLAGLGIPLLSACRSGDDIPAPSPGVSMKTGHLTSRHWPGHRPRWILMWPTEATKPRVVVSLHGKSGDAAATFNSLRLQDHILETGLAVAAVDGGNYYWHARRSESTGDDDISPDTPPCNTGAMVQDDVIPLLGRLGCDVSRIGLLGWSMGGYGALLLAETMGPEAVAAVAPMSAALWVQPGDSAPGAFDDAEDWHRHDVFARRARFAGIPIRLACGTSDPFYVADQTFLAGFRDTDTYDVTGVFDPGGHDASFWTTHAEGQMRFLAGHLHRR
jgi:poly(3-hydroxybutyrate) depolymerase